MADMQLSPETEKQVLASQKNEITEYHIYTRLAEAEKNPNNNTILTEIAQDELKHYEFWKKYTGRDIEPDQLKIFRFYFIARVLGLTFGIKLMEKGEEQAQATYERIAAEIPEAKQVIEDEDSHENELLNILNEEKLEYVGSMVLGMNDALVELTGALAGLTLALQNTHLIALTGGITGIAASLSMAASEYLSKKSEDGDKSPVKASLYTGGAYVITVVLLIFPYLLFSNYFICLGIALLNSVVIIFIFTFYISIAQDLSFWKRFCEMAGISLGVACVSFVIGFAIRHIFGIEV